MPGMQGRREMSSWLQQHRRWHSLYFEVRRFVVCTLELVLLCPRYLVRLGFIASDAYLFVDDFDLRK
jgi:hypothetical protein